MGDWRKAQVIGTCGAEHVEALRVFLDCTNYQDDQVWDRFGPLSHGGTLGALPNWAREQFDVAGSLAERNYNHEDVAEALRQLLEVAPSLRCKVHVGDHDADPKCVATVVAGDGLVEVCDPEIEEVPDAPAGQFESDLFAALSRR